MKPLFRAAAALLCAVGLAVSAYGQMTPVTATQLKMGGVLIPTGTVTFVPVGATGTPIAIVTSDGQLNGPQGFTASITNGAIADGFAVPDQCLSTAATPNTPVRYSVQVYNTAAYNKTTNPGGGQSYTVGGVQGVCGSAGWQLDHYSPTQTAPITATALMTGTTVPTRCYGASIFYTQATPSITYTCQANTYVQSVASGSGSGVTSYNDLTDKPTIPADNSVQVAANTAAIATETTRAKAVEATKQDSFVFSGTPLFDYDLRQGLLTDATGTQSALTGCSSGTPTYSAIDHGYTFSTTQNNTQGPCFSVPLATGVTLGAIELDYYVTPTAYTQTNPVNVTRVSTLLGPTGAYNTTDTTGKYEFYLLGTGPGQTFEIYAGTALHDVSGTISTAGHHTLTFNCENTGGRIYVDGAEIYGYASGTGACVNNITTAAQGLYQLGGGNSGAGSFYGKIYRFRGYSSALTGAQVIDNQKKFLASDALLGIPSAPVPNNINVPVAVLAGTSIDAGTGAGTTCAANSNDGQGNIGCASVWVNNVTWPASRSYTVFNYGIYNTVMNTIVANSAWREATICGSKNSGANVPAIIGSPSNDEATATSATAAWRKVTQWVATVKAAGCGPVYITTSLSRTSGYDAGKAAYTNLARANYKSLGSDVYLIDHNAIVLLGADGAYSSTTYFGDNIHPTAAAQLLMAGAASNAIKASVGSTAAAPTLVTATYTMGAGDTYVLAQPTAAATLKLPSCVGQTDAIYRINNLQTAFALTLQTAATTEPINGTDYSSTGLTLPNSIVTLRDVPNAPTAGGCHWEM